MKIKNFKCTLQAVNLALVLSLTGCSNYNFKKEVKSTEVLEQSTLDSDDFQECLSLIGTTIKDSVNEIKSKKTKVLTDYDIIEIINEINNLWFDCYYNSCFYNGNCNELTISRSRCCSDYEDLWIPDNFMSNINLLLNQDSFVILNLKKVDFDLSKLDISNLKRIDLDNIKIENAKKLMKKASRDGIELNYSLYDMDFGNSLDVVNYIIENNINCNFLYLIATDENELDKLCNLTEKINAKEIVFVLNPHLETENDININVKLNDNTSSFQLRFSYLFSQALSCDKKLGNIEINSNNELLSVGFQNALVTDDTRFFVPDNSEVTIYGHCNDFMPLYDLRKTSKVYYYDSDLSMGFNSTDPFESYSEFVDDIKDEHSKVLVK